MLLNKETKPNQTKNSQFQIIQFSLIIQFSSIWPIDRTLLGATTLGKSEPESDGNKSVLCIPQNASITEATPSSCFVSYTGHSLEGLTPLQRWSRSSLWLGRLGNKNYAIIFKKINIPFIVHFYLGKYSFSLDTFSTQLEFWRKSTFHSLFISVLKDANSISILSEHTSSNKNCAKIYVTLYRWPAKQTIPLSVLARNQTKGFWTWNLGVAGRGNGTREESWLDKGAGRQLAWNHGQGQSTPDTVAEKIGTSERRSSQDESAFQLLCGIFASHPR